ncbi:hypothetical protein H9P43_002356 [Blastocladiella emersonii ATCC 22665]|nr:hypothetical protein H9P43_002356 [Blastocladiella emersonii ATCC 22665]
MDQPSATERRHPRIRAAAAARARAKAAAAAAAAAATSPTADQVTDTLAAVQLDHDAEGGERKATLLDVLDVDLLLNHLYFSYLDPKAWVRLSAASQRTRRAMESIPADLLMPRASTRARALHDAAVAGNVARVRELLQYVDHADVRFHRREPALLAAVKHLQYDVVRALLAAGASPVRNHTISRGKRANAYHTAIKLGDAPMVRILLEAPAIKKRPNVAVNLKGAACPMTALHAAVMSRSVDVVEALLAAGVPLLPTLTQAEVDANPPPPLPELPERPPPAPVDSSHPFRTARAVLNAKAKRAKRERRAPDLPATRESEAALLLGLASLCRSTTMVKWLFAQGVPTAGHPRTSTFHGLLEGRAALMIAVGHDNLPMCKLLVEGGHTDVLKYLLDAHTAQNCVAGHICGWDSTLKPGDEREAKSFLQCATLRGYMEVIKTLLDYGAQVSTPANPWIEPTGPANPAALERIPGVDDVGDGGYVLTCFALRSQHVAIVDLLRGRGHAIQWNAAEHQRQHAEARAAASTDDDPLAPLPLLAPVYPAMPLYGKTPLHFVLSWSPDKWVPLADRMLDEGALVNVADHNGQTPLDLALAAVGVGIDHPVVKRLMAHGVYASHDTYVVLLHHAIATDDEGLLAMVLRAEPANGTRAGPRDLSPAEIGATHPPREMLQKTQRRPAIDCDLMDVSPTLISQFPAIIKPLDPKSEHTHESPKRNDHGRLDLADSRVSCVITPLMRALFLRRSGMVCKLLDAGANPNLGAVGERAVSAFCPPPGIAISRSPLVQAIAMADRDMVDLLLAHGASLRVGEHTVTKCANARPGDRPNHKDPARRKQTRGSGGNAENAAWWSPGTDAGCRITAVKFARGLLTFVAQREQKKAQNLAKKSDVAEDADKADGDADQAAADEPVAAAAPLSTTPSPVAAVSPPVAPAAPTSFDFGSSDTPSFGFPAPTVPFAFPSATTTPAGTSMFTLRDRAPAAIDDEPHGDLAGFSIRELINADRSLTSAQLRPIVEHLVALDAPYTWLRVPCERACPLARRFVGVRGKEYDESARCLDCEIPRAGGAQGGAGASPLGARAKRGGAAARPATAAGFAFGSAPSTTSATKAEDTGATAAASPAPASAFSFGAPSASTAAPATSFAFTFGAPATSGSPSASPFAFTFGSPAAPATTKKDEQ